MQNADTWVILIPIWGDAHIKMCAKFLLPSLLGRDNLPFLKERVRPVVRLLTTTHSSKTLKQLALFPKLSSYADVTFCYIDDLVNIGNYGFTLTMAYERGIQTDPEDEQLKRCYIFLNGDFVISNTTFSTFYNKIAQGNNAIVCPSLRLNENEAIPELSAKLTEQGTVLDCSSRELVKLAFANLHPTVYASMLSNTSVGIGITHQYFMQVSEDLIIARFFLITMLCIKPERPLPEVTSHCDYSFIPELCPSGKYTIITDSDEAFMLEISPFEQESEHIYLGPKNIQADAERMKVWATKEHAAFSHATLYFHSADMPEKNYPPLVAAQEQLDKVLNHLYVTLENTPRPSHEFHPFWINYLNLAKSLGKLPKRKTTTSKIGFAAKMVNKFTTAIFGTPPYVTKWHYKYHDYYTCMNKLQEIFQRENVHKILYVCADNKDFFRQFFEKNNISFELIRIDDLVNVENLRSYDYIFIEANQQGFNKFAKYMLFKRIPQDIKVFLFVDLITSAWQHHNIVPYLCTLNHKIQIEKLPITHGKQKWFYHEASRKFLNSMHGKKNPFKLGCALLVFAYSVITLFFINKFKAKDQPPANLDNLSSMVLNINNLTPTAGKSL